MSECPNTELNIILKDLAKRKSKWFYPSIIVILILFSLSFVYIVNVDFERPDSRFVMPLAVITIAMVPCATVYHLVMRVKCDNTLLFDVNWIAQVHGTDILYAIINDVQTYTNRWKPFNGESYVFFPRHGFLFMHSDIEQASVEKDYVSQGDDGGYFRTIHVLSTNYGRAIILPRKDFFSITQNIPGLKVSVHNQI
jgi:hypothetical protein